MRIEQIGLSWFRGAAESTYMDLGSKSIVVYGMNGSGKSTFVDAVEYVIRDGKINHLAHEYSGRRQERAILNTHKPSTSEASILIRFQDDTELVVAIDSEGCSTCDAGDPAGMNSWDYLRCVLRQGEVSDFIHQTKGQKYSSLLPLLGLDSMETAAENLRQLSKAIERAIQADGLRGRLQRIESDRKTVFGDADDSEVLNILSSLWKKYCPDGQDDLGAGARCTSTLAAVEERLEGFTIDQRRYVVLQDIASQDISSSISALRASNSRLAGDLEPFITERLQVLQSASTFAGKLTDAGTVSCPACGTVVDAADFRTHVESDRARLRDVLATFSERAAAISAIADTIKMLQLNLDKPEVSAWKETLTSPCPSSLTYLESLDAEGLRVSCQEEDLVSIESKVIRIVQEADAVTRSAPPSAVELADDKRRLEVCGGVVSSSELKLAIARIDALSAFVASLEEEVRTSLRDRANAIIDDISSDVQGMWSILHPNEAIRDVCLHVPEDSDKAIDIGLQFYGVEQTSPRLTLSEGHRNSLGLCIFLAMAKRDSSTDRPIFLDDVVVSVDRSHRGMVVELLLREFADRQIILLTHDRDWYTELRQQLDDKSWRFRALLPYVNPETGIRWSDRNTSFDDARAQLDDRPDAAGVDVRKIMDVELAIAAEKLRLRMPFLRGDKNDRRMAHDFLLRLISEGRTCFERRVGDGYESDADAVEALEDADRLLVSWANRSAHTTDVVGPEAAKLIDVCERALEQFTCTSCGKRIWFANAEGPECVQCQCGGIRWRYGRQ